MRRAGSTFVQIGKEFELNEDTVRKIWNRWQETGTCENASKSGRPTKLDKHDIRRLKTYMTDNKESRREPLSEIVVNCNLEVSTKTLKRTIDEHIGLGRRIARKKCFLTKKQKEARLKFAKEHVNWTIEDWKRVVFSDEMAMQTDSNQGRVWVWRYPEEEYHPDCIRQTVISGFQKVKIWGAMRYDKLSKLVVIPEEKGEGKMSAEKYRDLIMDGEFFDFWMESMEELGCVMMMEDGAPYHQGVATQRREQLEQDGWEGWGPGTWPSNSPDLNPIENLWYILKSQIRKRKHPPKTKEALIQALKEEWGKIPMEKVKKLIDSMPKRMKLVIAAKGGAIKY